MRTRRFLLLLGVALSHPVVAQNNIVLYDAYLNAIVYPEDFDLYIQACKTRKSSWR